jgi:hypothetical protein
MAVVISALSLAAVHTSAHRELEEVGGSHPRARGPASQDERAGALAHLRRFLGADQHHELLEIHDPDGVCPVLDRPELDQRGEDRSRDPRDVRGVRPELSGHGQTTQGEHAIEAMTPVGRDRRPERGSHGQQRQRPLDAGRPRGRNELKAVEIQAGRQAAGARLGKPGAEVAWRVGGAANPERGSPERHERAHRDGRTDRDHPTRHLHSGGLTPPGGGVPRMGRSCAAPDEGPAAPACS